MEPAHIIIVDEQLPGQNDSSRLKSYHVDLFHSPHWRSIKAAGGPRDLVIPVGAAGSPPMEHFIKQSIGNQAADQEWI